MVLECAVIRVDRQPAGRTDPGVLLFGGPGGTIWGLVTSVLLFRCDGPLVFATTEIVHMGAGRGHPGMVTASSFSLAVMVPPT